MNKEIKFYKQHTAKSCGASCILMLQQHYCGIPMSPGREKQIYDLYHCRAKCEPGGEEYGGILAAAIANAMSAKKVDVHLIHSSPNMMDNKGGYFSDYLYEEMMKSYREELGYCEKDIKITTGAAITCQTLKQELDKGRLLVVETIVPGDVDGIHSQVLHWVLVYGYEKDTFFVCDPGYDKIELTEAELDGYMNTPIGKICISVHADESTVRKYREGLDTKNCRLTCRGGYIWQRQK